jgi:hypothetical protein
MVYLNTQNIKTQWPLKKLNWKFTGLYQIKKKLSPYTYKLKLPTKMKIYLTFYISLLQLLKNKPLTYEVPPPPPIIIDNGNSSYFINSIDDMR